MMGDSLPKIDKTVNADHGPLGRIVAALNALGSVWIIALMLLIVADICMRTLANAPIAGTAEMVSYSIVGIVFLQLSHTLRSGNLTRTDMVLNYLQKRSPMIRRLLLVLFNLTGATLLMVALWTFFPNFLKAWSHPERNFMGNPGFFVVPLWPLYLLMVVGIAATVMQFLALAINVGRGNE